MNPPEWLPVPVDVVAAMKRGGKPCDRCIGTKCERYWVGGRLFYSTCRVCAGTGLKERPPESEEDGCDSSS